MTGDLKSYERLLLAFADAGYKATTFDAAVPATGHLLLRHDIDFDVTLAHELSLANDRLGFTSTFFFLVSSYSYNLLTRDNASLVADIRDRGHQISIHYDPAMHEDDAEGVRREIAVFSDAFDVQVETISIHRPPPEWLGQPSVLPGVGHTYEPRFFEEIAYVADSRGEFRYGHPLESTAFTEGRSIQMLIHPVWWVGESSSALDKLHRLVQGQHAAYMEHVALNCMPYRDHLRRLERDGVRRPSA